MKSMTKVLVAGALVTGFGLGWAAKGDEAVVSAQAFKPFMMKRIYTGDDGLSHVEQVELNAQSVLEKVTGAVVSVSQPGSSSILRVVGSLRLQKAKSICPQARSSTSMT